MASKHALPFQDATAAATAKSTTGATSPPDRLTVPTTWDAVVAHPGGLDALPWDPVRDLVLYRAVLAAGLTAEGLRLTRAAQLAYTPGLAGARAKSLEARLRGWGLEVGDLAPELEPRGRRKRAEVIEFERYLNTPVPIEVQ